MPGGGGIGDSPTYMEMCWECLCSREGTDSSLTCRLIGGLYLQDARAMFIQLTQAMSQRKQTSQSVSFKINPPPPLQGSHVTRQCVRISELMNR